jgi:hypothetical protein
MQDAVSALLLDVHVGHDATQDLDDQTSEMVGSICEHLNRLNVTSMGWNCDEEPFDIKITIASSQGEILLASLTSSELTSSIADLAAHLLHMLRFNGPKLQSIAMTPTDNFTEFLVGTSTSNNSVSTTRAPPSKVCG